MQKPNNTMPKAVEDCHALLAWIIPKLDAFPRARRFTLGERIESGLLFVLEKLIEAAYQKQRDEVLRTANLRLDVVRHLWRLSHGLKAVFFLVPTLQRSSLYTSRCGSSRTPKGFKLLAGG